MNHLKLKDDIANNKDKLLYDFNIFESITPFLIDVEKHIEEGCFNYVGVTFHARIKDLDCYKNECDCLGYFPLEVSVNLLFIGGEFIGMEKLEFYFKSSKHSSNNLISFLIVEILKANNTDFMEDFLKHVNHDTSILTKLENSITDYIDFITLSI